jgi:hypothetical protein
MPPTAAEQPPAVEHPKHKLSELTTYELKDYRRQLESAVKGISPDAPVQADLKRRLDEVLAEQEQRARAATRA